MQVERTYLTVFGTKHDTNQRINQTNLRMIRIKNLYFIRIIRLNSYIGVALAPSLARCVRGERGSNTQESTLKSGITRRKAG